MRIINNENERFTLAPGRYIISDPCYQVPDEFWSEVLDNGLLDGNLGHYKKGRKMVHVVAFGTSYGDGEYFDQEGNSYGVDAGMIGIMLVSDVGIKNVDFDGGRLVNFPDPFECYEKGGVIHFGHIAIDTDPEEEEEEDD